MVVCALLIPLDVVYAARIAGKAVAWGLPLAQLQGDAAENESQQDEKPQEANEEKVVRVDISVLAPPLKDYDETTEEVFGVVKNLLDIVSRESGLTFRYLEPKNSVGARYRLAKGEADIWACYGGNCEPMEAAELGEASVMIPMVRVCRKNELFTSLTRHSLAIVADDYGNRSIYDNRKGKTKKYGSMDQCYEAVKLGEADYLVDYLYAAQNRLWRSSRYKHLVIQQMPAARAQAPFQFMFSKHCDPATRALFEKTLSNIPQDELSNCLVTTSIPRVRQLISTEKVIAILVCLVVLALLLTILILNHQRLSSRDVVNELEDANRMAEQSLRTSRQSQSCLEFLLSNHDKRQAFEYICKLICLETGMEQCWIVLFGEHANNTEEDDEDNLFFYVDDGADGGHLHAVQGQEEYDLQRNTLAELVDEKMPLDRISARVLPSGKILVEVNNAKRTEMAAELANLFFAKTNAGILVICSIRAANGKLNGYVALTGSISYYAPDEEREDAGGMKQMLDVYVHTLNIYMNAEDTRQQLNMATEQRERIFNASPVAMVMFDTKHQAVMSNDKAKEISFGMERRLASGKCMHDFCAKDKKDECPVNKAFVTGKTIVTSESFGSRVYSVSTVPIYENGVVVNVVQAFTDQTALLNSERHFKKISELLSGIFSTMPCAAFIKECGDEFRYLLASDYLENAMGWEKGYVKGKTSRELFGEKADAFEDSDRLARVNGSWSGMIAMKTPHRLMNLFCVKRHIKDPDGHDMIIGVELDMTESIKQRRSLEITHEALQALPLQDDALACLPPMLAALSQLLDASSNVVVSFDGEKPQCSSYWNVEVGAKLSNTLLDAISSLKESIGRELKMRRRGEEADTSGDARLLDSVMDADGAQSVICMPISHDEKLWGILCFLKKSGEAFSKMDGFIVQDVEKIIELALHRSSMLKEIAAKEKRLHLALVDAKELASAHGEFLTAMSHEIRTPLNSIIGFAKCMDTQDLTLEQAHEYAGEITQPANALLNLLDDIMLLNNVVSGRMNVKNGDCDLVALLDELKREYEPKAASEVKLVCSIDRDEFPIVKLNDFCVRQVLDNLVGNAMKYTIEGTVSCAVRFKPTTSDVGVLELDVKDTGNGIDEVIKKIMFDPFVHHEIRGQRTQNGTGLGLPIVKAILEQAGGSIDVDSSVGKGSLFRISIPNVGFVSRAAARQAPPKAAEALEVPKGLRILVVDDVPLNLKITSKYLERFGAECHICTDSTEALSLLGKYKVDLVLTDLWMPGMNGMEMVKAIHAMPGLAKLPVAAITADTEVKNNAGENELVDILIKPITPDSLKKLLIKCVHG